MQNKLPHHKVTNRSKPYIDRQLADQKGLTINDI